MATVTVSGGNQPSFTYSGTANASLANSIAATLNSLFTGGLLHTATIGSGQTPPSPGGGTQNLLLTGGGTFDAKGYQYVSTNTDQPTTITGGTNLIGGDGSIVFSNTPGSTSTVVAGNGNDTFNLSGKYTAAGGNGMNYWDLSGSGAVSVGTGINNINATGPGADTIFAAADHKLTVVNGGPAGIEFVGNSVAGGGAMDSVFAGFGQVTVGSGADTAAFNGIVYGAANEGIYFDDPVAGSHSLLVAGAGNETLVAVYSKGNDVLVASSTPGTNDLLMGSVNATDYLLAGAGTDSLIGNGPGDMFFIFNAAQFGPGVKPTDLIYNANGGDTINLVGMDSLYGGAKGDAAQKVAAAFAGGSTTQVLKDGTTITFANTHGANGIHFISS